MKNIFSITLSTVALTLVSASSVLASGEVTPTPTATATPTPQPKNETSCESSYGGYGKQPCDRVDFIIDKKVSDPKNPSNYQDNFGVNNNKYVPGQTVPFRVTVKNTGTKTLNDVVIKDQLPSHVTLVSPTDNYDSGNRVLTINVGTLSPGEEKTFDITAQVNSVDSLPNDSVFCLTNHAAVYAEGQEVSDQSQFCVQQENVGGGKVTKGGKPVYDVPNVTTTPPTGPQALALLPILGSAIAGFVLRKKI